MLNETHDPALRSWVPGANDGGDFPLQNLPFGVYRRRDGSQPARVGVAIGDAILDVAAALDEGLLGDDTLVRAAADCCREPALNALMALGPRHWSALRLALSRLLRDGGTRDGGTRDGGTRDGGTRDDAADVERASRLLLPIADAELLLPARVGDYTDFYASVHHATNVGSMFRPENPLLPNYRWVPIGYHGRASSLRPSGAPVHRPHGQTKGPDAEAPTFGPSRMLDYELEVGIFVGPGNRLGQPIPIGQAEDHVFGLCLVNDWSARDVQAWEYQPLGPFLAKSFATTVSPWVVTMEALAPFRAPPFPRAPDEPQPLPYLRQEGDGGVELTLEVLLRTRRMRDEGTPPTRVSRTSFTNMYWTPAQLLAHHASNGCNLQPGDLLASGTVSGPSRDERGCLLELTWRGKEPLELPNGETRRFLEDGDEVTLRGRCEKEGAVGIGLGFCVGHIDA